MAVSWSLVVQDGILGLRTSLVQFICRPVDRRTNPRPCLDSRHPYVYSKSIKILEGLLDSVGAVAALGALAHEHRLALYRALVERGPAGLPAGAIAERLGVAPSSLTFHLQQLVHAGLITRRRAGRQIIYATDFTATNALVAY